MTNDLCRFERRDEYWQCQVCKAKASLRLREPPIAACRYPKLPLLISGQIGCLLAPLVVKLTPHGVDRLQHCRSANCGLMHRVDGTMRCVGMRGSKCQWIGNWADCLNGETPFPNGTPDCPHWKSSLENQPETVR